jgi:hypothetical protein
MKFDKITLKAQEALATAQQVAMAKSHTILSRRCGNGFEKDRR